MAGNIVVIIHIYGARTILILFSNHQGKKSESREIERGVAGPITTRKNIKGSMGQRYQFSTRWEQNIVATIHIYRAKAIFLLIYDNQDTES